MLCDVRMQAVHTAATKHVTNNYSMLANRVYAYR
jgi:hypothetical protein